VTQSWTSFKIGLFVLSGLALLLGGIAVLGLLDHLRRTVRFETYVVGSIDGLSPGSPVNLKGVRVGEVAEVGFSWVEYPGGSPPAVVIRFDVAPSALPQPADGQDLREGVRPGLRAMVETQGITGLSALSLDVASDAPTSPPLSYDWTPRYPVIPSEPGQLTRILASAQGALSKLEQLDLERLEASLEGTLRSADEALRQVRQIDAERISRDLDAAVASTGAAAANVRALAEEARAKLHRIPVDDLARQADGALVALRASSERLDDLLRRFSGLDVRDVNATLASTRRAAQDLQDTLAQLRRYPSGFLFGEAPPPARAVEAER
jgi:ABC-type transporter Mla subunit MlaD